MRRVVVFAVLLIAAGAAVLSARSVFIGPDPVTLLDAYAVADPDVAGALRVYVTMENGDQPNRLIAATSPMAQARLVGLVSGDVVLPAGSRPSLSGDGVYLELTELDGSLEAGRLIPITLTFEPSGPVSTRARLSSTDDLHSITMAEAMINPPEGPPELSITATPSGEDWQVSLTTDGFTFVPEMADPVHVPGEGHGHIYLNGLKLGRVYDHSVTFGALPAGQHLVEVSLNSNDHFAYEDANGPVRAAAMITVN